MNGFHMDGSPVNEVPMNCSLKSIPNMNAYHVNGSHMTGTHSYGSTVIKCHVHKYPVNVSAVNGSHVNDLNKKLWCAYSSCDLLSCE